MVLIGLVAAEAIAILAITELLARAPLPRRAYGFPMTSDKPLFSRIDELVAEEQSSAARRRVDADEKARLRALEVELDQCWDLLQRGQDKSADPDSAEARFTDTVEGYLN